MSYSSQLAALRGAAPNPKEERDTEIDCAECRFEIYCDKEECLRD